MTKICAVLANLAFAATFIFAADAPSPRKAPELSFNLPGEGQKLLSQYRGKVVALEFILTYCSHCQAAAKEMAKIQQEYASRGLQVVDVAINVLDNGNSEATASQMVQSFAQNYGANFPVGYCPRDEMTSFMGFSIMDRMVVPQLVLLDRKGYIHYQTPAGAGPEWDKLMDPTAIRQHIEELLSLGNSGSAHLSKTARKTIAK